MGWVELIISLFKAEPSEPEVEVISFSSLSDWGQNQRTNLTNSLQLDKKLYDYLNKLKEIRWSLELSYEELEPVQEIVPAQNISIQLKKLLSTFTFPVEISLEDGIEHNHLLLKELETIIPQIQDNVFKMPDLPVLTSLQRQLITLQNLGKGFEKFLREGKVMGTFTIIERMNFLDREQEKLNKLYEHKKDFEVRASLAEEKRLEKEQEFRKLKQDSDYLAYTLSKDKRKNDLIEIQKTEERVFNFFKEISPAFLVYNHFGNFPLLNNYLENPLQTFREDQSLTVLHPLNHLRALLSNGNIDLPLSTVTNISNQLDQINIENLQRTYFHLLRERNESKNDPDPSFLTRVEDLTYRLNHFTNQTTALEDSLNTIEERIVKQEEKLQRELGLFQNLVRINLGKNLVVQFSFQG